MSQYPHRKNTSHQKTTSHRNDDNIFASCPALKTKTVNILVLFRRNSINS